MRTRHALIGAIASLALTSVLVVRVVAVGDAGAVIILAPALLGSLLALRRWNRLLLVLAAVLTAATAVILLIGWVGLLYFPSIALFVSAAIRDPSVAGASE
jgi:hypothetical protein